MENTRKLSYIHISINAKAGLELTDCYGNPTFATVKEANDYGKREVYHYNRNEVSDAMFAIDFDRDDRTITKSERKERDHEYRLRSFHDREYGDLSYGYNY